ncbi:MAG: hypothetical protein IPI43_03175 [Sandaracinaceae bacterium]|nr:hypothetical protein [Sandaracinaceae bacterium]
MRTHHVMASSAVTALLIALLPISGCSLVVDSGQYVARTDAGPPEDSGTEDGSVEDQGSVDQGPITCNGTVCEQGQYCVDDNSCVECLVDTHCANGLCDPTLGVCINPETDCGACNPDEICTGHPAGGFACLNCDRDQDGFLSTLSLCDAIFPDCNDLDAQQYPGAAPKCGDGLFQGCATPEYDSLRALLPTIAEIARMPVQLVSEELAVDSQLSTVAMPGDYFDELTGDPNAAYWVFGFRTNDSEAQVSRTQYEGFNSSTVLHEWEGLATRMSNRVGWPIDAGKVTGFTVDGSAGYLNYAASGDVALLGEARVYLIADDGTNLIETANELQSAGFRPPLAIIGGTNPDVIYRDDNAGFSGYSRLRSLRSGAATAAWVTIPSDLEFTLDGEGEHVFWRNAEGLTGEVWDAVATTPDTVAAPPTVAAVMTGPARFSRDPTTGRLIGILPYDSGLRVVEYTCTAPGLDNCTAVASDIQSVLPALTHFDFEVLSGAIYLFSAGLGDGLLEIQLSVFTLDDALGLNSVLGPMPFISSNNPEVGTLFGVYAIESALQVGSGHAEIVVGTSVNRGAVSLAASGLRFCVSQ